MGGKQEIGRGGGETRDFGGGSSSVTAPQASQFQTTAEDFDLGFSIWWVIAVSYSLSLGASPPRGVGLA